jgi:DNA polymerase-3 subunit beta
MKFKINRAHFANGLAQVVNIVGVRASSPILSNVLLEAEGDVLSLITTNLDIGIRVRVKANISSPGTITLPVKKLQAIINTAYSEEVVVELSGPTRVKVSAGKSNFQIMGIPPDTFPALTTFANQHNFVLKQEDLATLLRKVSYGQSTDENRYILNGVFFHFAEGKLTLVATDGRRLALAAQPFTLGPDETGGLILPAKTVVEIQRLLGAKGEVKIAFNERHVSFIIDAENGAEDSDTGLVENIFLVSKLIEGNFPNYKQVVPKETVHRIEVERTELLKVLKCGRLMASDKSASVKITLADNKLEVASSTSDLGDSSDDLAINYEGPPVNVSFNPQYLADPLNAIDDDNVAFEFKDDVSPGVLRDKGDFFCVIMPQRT